MNVGGRRFVDQFNLFQTESAADECFIDTVTLTVRPEARRSA